MEFYDSALTRQLAPLVTFCLGPSPLAQNLQTYIDRVQLSSPIWDNVIIKKRLSATKFRIQYAPTESLIVQKIAEHKDKTGDAHSTISPFNSSSELFPSGVISSEWFRKYAYDIPFAVVCVYELGPTPEKDAELAEELAATRIKYSGYNVRFVAIVVSTPGESGGIQDRLSQLRQISGLANLSGLFHLVSSVENLQTDCEVLVSALFNALKISATDFYSGIELRVKQRFKKYYNMPRSDIKTSIELSPKILETRNLIKQGVLLQLMHPHNVESSIQVLEQSYENLLDLISKSSSHFFSKARTPHDLKVYVQWRTLLDVLAIHLVRGYFSIEEPVYAMKRHKLHVYCVGHFLTAHSQSGIKLWVATQNQWLAELMVLIPSSILQGLYSDPNSKGRKPRGSIEYFGGILFMDKSSVVTSPNLIYKLAADGLTLIDESETRSEVFSERFASLGDILKYKIKLLESAMEHTSTSDSTSLASLEPLLLCDIADCYMDSANYEKAIHVYETAQKKCLSPTWSNVYRLVSQKVISAAEKREDFQTVLKQITNLSIFDSKSLENSLGSLDLSNCPVIDLENQIPFTRVDVSLFNASLEDDVRVADTITTQIRIESIFNTSLLETSISESEVDIFLNYIDVQYENGDSIRLTNEGSQTNAVQKASLNSNKAAFNFSEFGKRALVLQLQHEASGTGWFSVNELAIFITVRLKLNTKETLLNKRELIVIDHQKIKHAFDLYLPEKSGAFLKKKKDLKGRNSCKLFVKPYRPNIVVEPESKFGTIIVGERFETPIKISFPNTSAGKTGCNSVKLLVETILYDDMIETKDLHAQVNWDLMKDDEPMELLEAIQAKKNVSKHNLHVSVTRSPSSRLPDEKDLKIVLYFKLIVTSLSSEVSEYDITQLELNVLPNPFSQTFDILPCIHDDGSSPSIPNPFVLEKSSVGLSMPSISRSWLFRTQIQDIHHLLQSNGLCITQTKLHVRSKTSDITTTWLNELSFDDMTYGRKLMTSGRHRPATTSATVVASASFFTREKVLVSKVVTKRKRRNLCSHYRTHEYWFEWKCLKKKYIFVSS
ncbi:hypothetical protein JCM33374_g5839 [Metschnikowia sp. JCM 33374]|nr:hypothetical protein JCM33374_g5839 [Metschnikowia sp. JCM 33374]